MLLYIITIICLFFQAERAILDTYYVIRNLKKSRPSPTNKKIINSLYIIIPVLNEQKIIHETIKNIYQSFGKISQIIIVTTEQENRASKLKNNKKLTTEQVINKILKSPKSNCYRNVVKVIRYPKSGGRMAHQINFALKYIYSKDRDSNFILYNADSIPSPKSSLELNDFFTMHPNSVVQQPCAFIRDAGPLSSPFVNALSLYQTLFSIGHEMGLISRYLARIKNSCNGFWCNLFYSPLGWIVGHGSGMSVRTCLRYGGYPEKYYNEDMTFGYLLSALRVPIHTISSLEIADVPGNWRSMLHQKTVWFWNFLEYPRCYRDTLITNISVGRKIALLIIGVARAAYWFFDAIFFWLPIVLGILFLNLTIIVLGLAGILFFSFVPIIILHHYLPHALQRDGMKDYAKRVDQIPLFKSIIVIPLVILIDSAGPWIALVQWIRWKITNVLPEKLKTD